MWTLLKTLAVLALAAGVAIIGLRLAYPLPAPPPPPEPALALPDTTLSRALAPAIAEHPGTSGVIPLASGIDAFVARILLARAAEASIDAQYYIWQDDLTGIRLLSELQAAARRGVGVRLLVDDNGTPSLDQELAALDALPAAEVRFFNPFTLRDHRVLNYAIDFVRLNRRMHNKSFTVDGVATIVGGRNIGDIYFETGAGHTYLDLDALAVGPAARDVAQDFAAYWTSGAAYRARDLIQLESGAETLLDTRDAVLRDTPQGQAYSQAARASTLISGLADLSLPLDWVPVKLLSDDPAKAHGGVETEDLLVYKLMEEIDAAQRSFDIISAYFIPGQTAAERFAALARSGVRVRILTNALEATDVIPVHASYVRYRKTLLEGGIRLFELKSQNGTRRTVNELGIRDFSDQALHAKSFALDRRRAFVGSMNFDPRSRRLNTEMGLVIDSPAIASGISDWLDATLPALAYGLALDKTGKIVWTLASPGEPPQSFTEDPNTSAPLRMLVRLIGYLPVQWML